MQNYSIATRHLKLKPLRLDHKYPGTPRKFAKLRERALRAERKWKKTRGAADFASFKRHKNHVTHLLKEAKSAFLTDFVSQNCDDQGKVFRAVKDLLVEKSSLCFSDYADKSALANDIGKYFVEKINRLCDELDQGDVSDTQVQDDGAVNSDSLTHPTRIEAFKLLTEEDVRMLIASSKSTSCCLDPIPTHLLKSCSGPLIPVITKIINNSLELGIFPECWKEAIVIPLLKKLGLDSIFKNLRPVSNLAYVSKLIERAVFNQTYDHLVRSGLYPLLQSAYRKYHSTETALVKVANDILLNMNSQRVTLLVLLDLSAAFDTVDHSILLQRLMADFGIRGKALGWFSSYLSGRSQRVLFEGSTSDSFDLRFGVPQGSCLGPLLFVLYASKLFEIVEVHLPDAHCFADDTQLYLSFDPNSSTDLVKLLDAMERCISDLRKWMYQDKLKINDDKTEFLVIGSKHQLQKIDNCSVRVGTIDIKPVSEVRNLGAWFDSHFSMSTHISKSCSAAFFWLRNIKKISQFLPRDKLEMVLHAFVTSRIDYCNGLLYGLPDREIGKLQRVQNAAARLLTSCKKYDHITPVLRELHWLPVKYRINFKILLLTFKALHGIAPSYISDLIKVKHNTRYSLRSNEGVCLMHPKGRMKKSFGDRSFSVAAPTLWNNLPASLRSMSSISSFKSQLKTHLFRLAFNSF